MPTSVIIPCRNAAGTIADAVSTALDQTVPPLEVIVVDDTSTDESARIAEAAGARVIRLPQRSNAGGARNRGIDAARGDVIAFLDADVRVPRDWLARVDATLRSDASIAAVGGRIDNGRPGRWADAEHVLNLSEWTSDRSRACSGYPTMAIAYRRSAIGANRFPATNHGEDVFFASSVAGDRSRIWYDALIRVEHRHERLDWQRFWNRQIDAGRTFYLTRRSLQRPGRILLRIPALLFLFPHLWLVLRRMLDQRMLGKAVLLFPWLLIGEIARIVGFFRARGASSRSTSTTVRQPT
jgi:glycosyltransferase involved in cell wall biosynthesis